MKVGIFSKIGANGGSEHRCVEMANGLIRYAGCECDILCEKDINSIIEQSLDESVGVIKNVFKPTDRANPDVFYDYDLILVVNSDSYSFSQVDYWEGTLKDSEGNLKHHPFKVDISRIPKMVFLYNFVVSPAQWLHTIAKKCKDTRIVTANVDFYHQIQYKDKFNKIRKLPCIVLESPIDPSKITSDKTESGKIRIGKHSKAHDYKHNEQWPMLIDKVNQIHGDKIEWDFMGVPSKYESALSGFDNVTVRKEYSTSVGEYLQGIDIFCFFISWGRYEPWARVVAEAMMAGCPIIATDRAGNRDQVHDGLNGYLCTTVDQFAARLCMLIENEEIRQRMRENNLMCAETFTPDKVIEKFMEFVK